jgi:hypothetical protein
MLPRYFLIPIAILMGCSFIGISLLARPQMAGIVKAEQFMLVDKNGFEYGGLFVTPDGAAQFVLHDPGLQSIGEMRIAPDGTARLQLTDGAGRAGPGLYRDADGSMGFAIVDDADIRRGNFVGTADGTVWLVLSSEDQSRQNYLSTQTDGTGLLRFTNRNGVGGPTVYYAANGDSGFCLDDIQGHRRGDFRLEPDGYVTHHLGPPAADPHAAGVQMGVETRGNAYVGVVRDHVWRCLLGMDPDGLPSVQMWNKKKTPRLMVAVGDENYAGLAIRNDRGQLVMDAMVGTNGQPVLIGYDGKGNTVWEIPE